MGLSRSVRLHILWRAFFLQGAWNFRGMQNIGFSYALLPGLTRPAEPEDAPRLQPFFNTQPYMAPTILGVVLRLREQGREEASDQAIGSISGSLAAIGDTFFWATLKPIMALVCLIAVMAGQIWGVALALVFYNTCHLWVMIWGFSQGYRHGLDGALHMAQALSPARTRRLYTLVPLGAGMVFGLLLSWPLLPTGPALGVKLAMGLALFVLGSLAWGRGVPVLAVVYGVFTLILIGTMIA